MSFQYQIFPFKTFPMAYHIIARGDVTLLLIIFVIKNWIANFIPYNLIEHNSCIGSPNGKQSHFKYLLFKAFPKV
jgi:hypothetical protein